MAGNDYLGDAKKNKKNEFYTQMSDITNELKHYRNHFAGKVVLCNCDSYESNFFKYFASNFNFLNLKKLICTSYKFASNAGTEFPFPNNERCAYKIEITELPDANGDGAYDMNDVDEVLRLTPPTVLKGDGDFRSEECIEILKEADIVVSNPPFSYFREYLAQIVEYNKKFLIIGNVNAITYKEVFPLIKENKLWLGPSIVSGDRKFEVPEDYPLDAAGCGIDEKGTRFIRVKGVRWFTNLEHRKRHEELDLYKVYSPEEYPHYDNYDAIDVNKTADIPIDYDGVMGVPITFIDKYCPSQFEILGITQRNDDPYKQKKYTKEEYKNANDLNCRAVIMVNGIPRPQYARILIRKFKTE